MIIVYNFFEKFMVMEVVMSNDIREPIQKRSIEKKDKIIDCGFKLICEKGYHNTNTAEIAKEAGVSTGIVYSYFKDKHDILIAGMKKHSDSIFYPLLEDITNGIKSKKTNEILSSVLRAFVSNYKVSEESHRELLALIYLDKEIEEFYHNREMQMTEEIYNLLIKYNFEDNCLKERIHLILSIIDDYCHEVIYHKHKEINYDSFEKIVIANINYLLHME